MVDYTSYLKKIEDSPEFQKLKELKSIIDKKYPNLIIAFKNKEALYLDAKRMEKYFPDFEKVKSDFLEAKKNLYSKEEVKEYFQYERRLQEMLDEDMNELKASISNKFSLSDNFFNKI